MRGRPCAGRGAYDGTAAAGASPSIVRASSSAPRTAPRKPPSAAASEPPVRSHVSIGALALPARQQLLAGQAELGRLLRDERGDAHAQGVLAIADVGRRPRILGRRGAGLDLGARRLERRGPPRRQVRVAPRVETGQCLGVRRIQGVALGDREQRFVAQQEGPRQVGPLGFALAPGGQRRAPPPATSCSGDRGP